MTSISTSQKKNLNKMNRASKDVLLGTVVSDLITSASATTGTLATSIATLQANSTVSASHVVLEAESNASRVVLVTGLTTVAGFVGTALRSGSPVINAYMASGSVAGTIEVKKSTSGSAIAKNDVITYIAF
jgi:hypothetical protein